MDENAPVVDAEVIPPVEQSTSDAMVGIAIPKLISVRMVKKYAKSQGLRTSNAFAKALNEWVAREISQAGKVVREGKTRTLEPKHLG